MIDNQTVLFWFSFKAVTKNLLLPTSSLDQRSLSDFCKCVPCTARTRVALWERMESIPFKRIFQYTNTASWNVYLLHLKCLNKTINGIVHSSTIFPWGFSYWQGKPRPGTGSPDALYCRYHLVSLHLPTWGLGSSGQSQPAHLNICTLAWSQRLGRHKKSG